MIYRPDPPLNTRDPREIVASARREMRLNGQHYSHVGRAHFVAIIRYYGPAACLAEVFARAAA